MAIEKQPFKSYTLDKDKVDKGNKTISLKLNKEEQEQLKKDKQLLQQEKDGTAIKQLMQIGTKVIHDDKIGYFLKIVLENKRKNKRLGIVNFD